jgi:hypothetical protein
MLLASAVPLGQRTYHAGELGIVRFSRLMNLGGFKVVGSVGLKLIAPRKLPGTSDNAAAIKH